MQYKKFLKQFVLVKLYTDGGKNHREKRQYEIERFGTAAQPFYAILDENEMKLLDSLDMTRDLNEFKDFLNKGLEEG